MALNFVSVHENAKKKIDFYINQQYRFHVIKNIFNPVLDKQTYF